MGSSNDFERNRETWDAWSDDYQASKNARGEWGVWSIPEDELEVLGDVRGKDVLELGCGAAQWSIKLAQAGARPVGLDNSERQLEHARELQAAAGVDFPLVHGPAERLPFDDESFDVVFCDWGAMTFADPRRTVPEVARVLRPGGLLAFSGDTPWTWCCWKEDTDETDTTLHRDYFGLHRWETPEGTVEFQLTYGDWIRLFRANGLAVEDLIEIRAPEHAHSTFRSAEDHAWAQRWPMEQIWKVRKE